MGPRRARLRCRRLGAALAWAGRGPGVGFTWPPAPFWAACSLRLASLAGRLSLVRLRGTYLLYARANTKKHGGGRFVQVARTRTDDARSAYGPFALLRIAGYVASPATRGVPARATHGIR